MSLRTKITVIALLAVLSQVFAQQVVTNPVFVRGATRAYGRSTITGVAITDLLEHGFCWSTQPEPTVLDNKTTTTYYNNGYIYRMENLTPATIYYARAYIITKDGQTLYGDVIKIITIPKGNTVFTYDNGAASDVNARINSALQSAADYYCNLTSIQGYHVSCSYNAGVQTADCSYGGYMRMGPNPDYQRTGTVLHEMAHGVGVGQHSLWYGPNSPLRTGGTTGLWLGERANSVLRFLENKQGEYVTGDTQHFWPASNSQGTSDASALTYGINGSWEDTGNELIYVGNCLIVQAFGEDGLPPTNGFATPAYTFPNEDSVKYYIKNEADFSGQNTSFLMENASGNLVNTVISQNDVLNNDSAAWYLKFNPATCYYQIINAATGHYFTYNATGTNGIKMTAVTTPLAYNSFQLMGSRSNSVIGIGNTSTVKGYWIVRPQATLNPPCFASGTAGTTTAATFNIADASTAQRWLFLTADEVTKLIDPIAAAPAVTATPMTYFWIQLNWNVVDAARGYNIYRAAYPDSTDYTLLRSAFTQTRYDDDWDLTPNTVYWYKVTSVNNSGESDTEPVRAITNKTDGTPGDGATAIEGITAEDLRIYPNPGNAGQQIFVENANTKGTFSIKIADAAGRTVLQFDDNEYIYAPESKGIYFVKVVERQRIKVCKLIVK